MAKGAMTKSPKTGGKVYAGGSPNFDESKGRYTSPPRGSERLSPGVYRTPSGGLMSGQGRPLPSTGPQMGRGLADSMQGMQNYPGRVPAGNVPNRPMGPPLRQDLSQRMPPGYDQSMLDAITGAANGISNEGPKGRNVFGPKGPARVDQPMNGLGQTNTNGVTNWNPGMAVAAGQAIPNYNPYGYSQPQQQQLGLSQLSNMSNDQLPQYLNQMRQAQQPQQMGQPSANMNEQYQISPFYAARMQAMQQQPQQMPPPQMPQPSANMGGQYRLSPGVYGTREQAMQQYQQQMEIAQFNPSMYLRGK